MSELLERDPEVQIIEAALDAAAAGDGRLVLVEAPAGLGKSTLLAAARARAEERGFEVLAARGREQGRLAEPGRRLDEHQPSFPGGGGA